MTPSERADLVEETQQKVLRVLYPKDEGSDDLTSGPERWSIITNVLFHVLAFHLALCCPICRKKRGKEFAKLMPRVVAEAAQIVRETGGTEPKCSMH